MKANTLIILNYQRVIPPFIITEISFAKEQFANVVYVTRRLEIDNSNLVTDEHVKVIQVSRKDRVISFLKMPVLFFRKEIIREIVQAANNHAFSLGLIKNIGRSLFAAEQLYLTSEHILSTVEISKIRVLCTWYDSIAYAGARLKKKYNLKCVSFAHSYEIDPLKSKYIGYQEDYFKNENIDSIYFISKSMITIYKECVHVNLINESKIKLRYLGSIHRDNFLTHMSRDGVLRIVSCSGIIPVKRLEKIILALRYWDSCKLEWTHLGGGLLFDDIKAKAEQLMVINSNVKIIMNGIQQPNSDIQMFYKNNPIDLFVNVSSSEGLPVSIMEAMSFGIPCIASNVGGTAEIVNERNGYLISSDATEDELLRALTQYLHSSLGEKLKQRNCAYEHWNKYFNADKNAPIFYNEINR